MKENGCLRFISIRNGSVGQLILGALGGLKTNYSLRIFSWEEDGKNGDFESLDFTKADYTLPLH